VAGWTSKAIAYHESGHVVAGLLMRRNVKRATADRRHGKENPRSPCRGYVVTSPVRPRTWGAARNAIMFKLAGMAAECMACRINPAVAYEVHSQHDVADATEILLKFHPKARLKKRQSIMWGACWDEAVDLLRSNWPAVEAVAERLMKGGVVEGTELRTLVKEAVGR
jgi:hypothetical protein